MRGRIGVRVCKGVVFRWGKGVGGVSSSGTTVQGWGVICMIGVGVVGSAAALYATLSVCVCLGGGDHQQQHHKRVNAWLGNGAGLGCRPSRNIGLLADACLWWERCSDASLEAPESAMPLDLGHHLPLLVAQPLCLGAPAVMCTPPHPPPPPLTSLHSSVPLVSRAEAACLRGPLLTQLLA
jgi:hypothetical protein